MRFQAAGGHLALLAAISIVLAVGSSRAETSDSIRVRLSRCDSLRIAGRAEECADAARGILDDLGADQDTSSLEVARASELLSRCLARARGAIDANCQAAAEHAVRIRERLQGADHPDLARSLNVLALAKEASGNYEGAASTHERALAILETATTANPTFLAESLVALANLRSRLGLYAGLQEMYERAAGIQERILGPGDPALANTLKNHAILAKLTGDLERSRALYLRALEIEKKAYGEQHPRLGTTYLNLANLLAETGEYDQAQAAYERALEIRLKALGPDHPDVAMSQQGLALLLIWRGDLIGARDLAETALGTLRRHFGPDHPRVLNVEGALATVFFNLGDLQSAEDLAEHALSIGESTLGPQSPKFAELLVLLGEIHWAAGEFERAEEEYRRSLSLREAIPGVDPRDLAQTLNSLASRLLDLGRPEAVRPLVKRAAGICEAVRISNSTMEQVLITRARLAILAARPDSARRDLSKVWEIQDATVGDRHPRRPLVHLVQAACSRASGDQSDAVLHALASERIGREHLRWTVQGLTQSQALAFAETPRSGLDLALSIATEGDLTDSLNRAVWDGVIRSRAVVLDEMIARRRSLRNEVDLQTRELHKKLAAACRELSWLASSRRQEETGGDLRDRFESVHGKKEALERELASRSLEFVRNRRFRGIGLNEVIGALPDGGALVAFVRYLEVSPGEIPALQESTRPLDARSYGVFVLPADRTGVLIHSLGLASEIDQLVQDWRDEAGLGAEIPGRPEAVAESMCRQAGERLRRRIWDPIADKLQGAERIYVIPDGSLHLVNFDALPLPDGGYLVGRPAVVERAGIERDLVQPPEAPPSGHGLLALGDPDFDADISELTGEAGRPLTEAPSLADTASASQSASTSPMRNPGCRQLSQAVFTPLPRSSREVKAIADLWDAVSADRGSVTRGEVDRAVRLTRRDANEGAWKQLAGGFRAHHIATHGFFLGGEGGTEMEGSRGVSGVRPAQSLKTNPGKRSVLAENPLLLSGFVLAGANNRERAGADGEDGIVTAEEIGELNLDGAEWAVLSACETALGEIRSGEGVLGLHRAFRLAGVNTVVMSLWSVQDRAAELWMKEFYHARLNGGLPTGEAVRWASRAILQERRARGQSTHPFYWAGFVASGDGR